MPLIRKATDTLIEMAQDGLVSWEQIARSALGYMSEAEVADMAHCEGFIDQEEEENEIEDAQEESDGIGS